MVVLSVAIAIFGGYVGLGLAAQASNAFGLYRRGLLAGAAWSLGLSIWTMHFVGMLAARLPDGALFSVLLTLLSFLLCVIVVGVAAFLVSNYATGKYTAAVAACIMGMGIVLMHYLGMHAIVGSYMLHHDLRFSILAAAIAVFASYGALRMFESDLTQKALSLSALIFGLAVSGMHYTAMLGMSVMPAESSAKVFGPAVSGDALMIIVAVLAFVVSAVFLLYLVPEKKIKEEVTVSAPSPAPAEVSEKSKFASMLPVESEGSTKLFPVTDIYSIRATTHYSMVFDGSREHFSPWSITVIESRLNQDDFMRVHRSHILAIGKVKSLRKSGDGAVVELGKDVMRIVPVSRSQYAQLKSRLGLHGRQRAHAVAQQA